MGFGTDVLDLFRRGGIRTGGGLAAFLDARATLLAQECVDEYTKGRAGADAGSLFADAAFSARLERARHEAYPVALTMLGEMAEGVLRPHAGEAAGEFLRALEAVVLRAFDSHPAPARLTPQAWRAARDDITRWLDTLPRHPPKRPADIVEPFAPSLLAIMPIHDRLHGENFPALQNYLRETLTQLHDEFVRQMQPRKLVSSILHA